MFPEPVPVTLLGDDGRPLGIDPRGGLTAAPAWFTAGPRQARRAVRSWAGPWPLRERGGWRVALGARGRRGAEGRGTGSSAMLGFGSFWYKSVCFLVWVGRVEGKRRDEEEERDIYKMKRETRKMKRAGRVGTSLLL